MTDQTAARSLTADAPNQVNNRRVPLWERRTSRSSRLRRFPSPPPVFAFDVVLAALASGLNRLRVTFRVTSTRNYATVQPFLWSVDTTRPCPVTLWSFGKAFDSSRFHVLYW